MIQAHPLTGIGYGQFYYLYRDYGGMLWSQVSPHNTYLSIAAETGLLNFVIFLILSVATFFDLRQLKIKALNLSDPWTVHLSETLKMSIIVALISGLTLDQSNWLLFYICVALVAVLKRICPQAHWATQVVSVSESPSAISYHISLGQQR
jgi:O-antigen ligase